MPHINRIRLVNVNFNDAKGIYDDFMMNLDGKSTTYDLINTGGKSLLLLMLLQTVIPNTYLKKEKPVKNIFLGGNPRRTSHCLVEWILDDGYQYKYMLTGFCARKKQDTDDDTNSEDKLEIDYYNYCYFYNDGNKYDIKRIPLSNKENGEKIIMSYDKLRQLIGEMKKEELPIKAFDSKKEYMKYIQYYGLIPAEWKLISEINVSENYIEKYFKENKTSRKLIENFLIKIIDSINMQNDEEDNNENQLADTLIELKDNLMEFRRKSDNKNEFLQAREMYNNLSEKNNILFEEFSKVEVLNKKAYEAFAFKTEKKKNLESKIEKEINQIEELKRENFTLNKINNRLEIDKLYFEKEEAQEEKQKLENNKNKIEEKYNEEKRNLEFAKSQNEYVEYSQNREKAEQTKIEIDNLNLNEDDAKSQYEIYGYNYKLKLKEKIEKAEQDCKEKTNCKREKENVKIIAKEQENKARVLLSQCNSKIDRYEEEISAKQEEISFITQEFTEAGKLELILAPKESIEKEKDKALILKQEVEENKNKISDKEKERQDGQIKLTELNSSIALWEERGKNAKQETEKYENDKNSLEKLAKTFEVGNIAELAQKLQEELKEQEKQRNLKQIEKQLKAKKLELIEKYNMMVPNEDIFNLKEKLQNKCNYITTGIEKLMEIEENKRAEILRKNPLFIYSIFVDDETFKKIKNNGIDVESENLVPIASVEILRGEYTYEEKDIIFPIQKNVYQNLNTDQLNEYKNNLKRKIESLENSIETYRQKEQELKQYLDEINTFQANYAEEKVKSIYKAKDDVDNKIEKIKENIRKTHNLIENCKEEIEKTNKLLEKNSEELTLLEKEIQELEELESLQEESKELNEKKKIAKKDFEAQKEILEEKEENYNRIEEELERIKDEISRLNSSKENLQKDYDNLPQFNKVETMNVEFEELKNQFEALDNKMKNSNQEIKGLQDKYNLHLNMMKKCEENIINNNCTLEYFLAQNLQFEKISGNVIEELNEKITKLNKDLEEVGKLVSDESEKVTKFEGKIELLIKRLFDENQETYLVENRIKQIEVIEQNIKQNNIKLKLNKKQITDLETKIGEIEKEANTTEKECSLLESFITEREIEEFEVDISKTLESEIYTYRKIVEERKKNDKIIEKLTKEFAEYIDYIKAQTENFYIKYEILGAIEGLKVPSKLVEAKVVEQGISTIIESLDENIRHIEEALKVLEGYQENFITKCFEKAETIVRDLEKLPGLSRIKIGGKDINIIKLELFEYEREEKKNRMKEYIYKLVKEMEESPDTMNRETLNESLSSKSLVSQIVNMDKASVKLFKIEDIQENSTYKKWEDDLGSDGQVNAIYFMFAVCIISYISMLTRRESSSKSRKVIIADNPFGATSAVFLWNVMFAILKENNVQLIAPGHNINKEIISKFEVNYVLKHEYYNGNKKSVVVDKELRTEENLDNMSFETISGNQQSIFG